ncbi:crotonase/enoyl-CoA hydratase family protein [Limnohabitans sp. 15K]|uniref:crotonase/enoyl-CoA hydratase family protein n=1 Tax=Limnohabitans sp. 15K TaxID=1100706 RepID=UPI0013042ABD|nr:crotonase/enoyl-CoA hydratase family protein [Limnohabitans sp. 15K]
MNTLVRYDLNNGVATLRMDDGKANVMNIAMLAALNGALDRAEQEAKVVVLSGRDGSFSGGFDLGVFKRGGPDVQTMLEEGMRLCARLVDYPLPVIAACTGHAVALGAILLLSCDLRVGVDVGARFQINEVRLGMVLPRLTVEVCLRKLAPAQMHTATTLGMPFTPASALLAGFVDELVPAYAMQEAVQRHCADLLALDSKSFAMNKHRINAQVMEAMAVAMKADMAEWNAAHMGMEVA